MKDAARDAAYTEFVVARQTQLRRLAFALCGDWHLADDILQIALVKLYVAWPRLRHDGREESYVRRIIVRTNIDEHRRPWRRERPGLEGQPEGVAEQDHEVEERDALVSCLQELPVMQRKVVVLRHLCDLSIVETAAELGIGEGTVKSHNARGLERLQAVLTPQ